jgi:hypothetical protein
MAAARAAVGRFADRCATITAEAKDEKFMSSSGLEATEHDLEGYSDDVGDGDSDFAES